MRSFVTTWRRAKQSGIKLPVTDDLDYVSLEALLRHALSAARGYMVWMCEKLGLDDPRIDAVPATDEVEVQADAYLDHLLERWRLPLAGVAEERFDRPVYPSRWGVDYCIDAMLEHAVMHPIRHTFQLEELLERNG